MHKTKITNILAYIIFTALLLASGCVQRAENNIAINGILDLSGWSFNDQGPAELDGEWEFHPGITADPELIFKKAQKDFIFLPSIWKDGTARGKPLKRHGTGTYRLKVKLAPNSTADSLYISGVLSVCSVWVNGNKIGSSGIIGSSPRSEIPQKHLITPTFAKTDGYVDITIQVSNFHNKEGGINSSILLGSREQIQDLINYRRILGAIIGGALLIMGIYHLVIFLMRRSNRENLYFGLFCIVWCIATVFNPPSAFLITKFFTIDWSWYIKICLLPMGLAIPLLLFFYHSLFPKKHGKIVNWVYCTIGGLYAFYILTSSPSAYSPVALVYFIISRTAYIYLFACFISDLKNKRKGAIYLAPGYLALACAEFDEIFFDMNIFNSVDFAPLGSFIFIMSYSLFMSARFAETLSSYEKISGELKAHKQTEHDHKVVHMRLSKILDSVDEAIIAISSNMVIDQCNSVFENLSGFKLKHILGQDLEELLKENGHPDTDEFIRFIKQQILAKDSIKQKALIFPIADGNSMAASISIHTMKVANETIYVISIKPETITLDKRQLAVVVMNASIECWKKCTGKDKADLAEDSGLWNVYFEKDGYARTQTLDRYLNDETLPLRPRWKNVHSTAEFVLSNCSQQTDCYSKLEKNLTLLKNMS